ncbi:class I SAM-dependent methyltransferase [Brevundimonas sp. P7753]|uniref:Eco57I restriction-modification methylase domain-containing protein n=1 Tax=Brevundimonas sp. P7753 TaxID=2726982 RepID=UPI0015BCCDF8|nr:class I SAM-dependent methyltransferase [Brevundimonas sp. P7753]NWE53818.1 class I SAM-dependent methyltransferase [Brevundimonas sp. P7753]
MDFGAGDGRFAHHGEYSAYLGYEIDQDRCQGAALPNNASLVNQCAFQDVVEDADVCIGNPPFVRNQDLPLGWRAHASQVLKNRTGLSLSGLANAWQYFFLLSLTSCKADGLVALVIPYEWVSRPSVRDLRDYIRQKGWRVRVYRLVDTTFDSVLTTSSITIIDKSVSDGDWRFFEETADGAWAEMPSESGSESGVIPYRRRGDIEADAPRAIRGLSPGTQKVLTLTEPERVRFGLEIDTDVVPCVTTLRSVPSEVSRLDDVVFRRHFRDAGQKCWLIRTDAQPGRNLLSYLNSVPAADYQTATCLERAVWWRFNMPPIPDVLMAQSFRDFYPKAIVNSVNARAIGGVCGVHNLGPARAEALATGLDGLNLRDRVVAHSNGLRKIEINQINAILLDVFGRTAAASA